MFLILTPPAAAQLPTAQKNLDWFDGKPKTFVVNGYSTSFHWPAILQRKLDKYSGSRVIDVQSATQGNTPIAKWMNVDSGQPSSVWIEKLQPLLQDQRQPTIVLAQQSLQLLFDGRSAGIRSAQDTARIHTGSQALAKYADLLIADGADSVVIAMHIYKQPMEPEIGNERFALAQFMASHPSNVHAGPDVWSPTRPLYPQAFQADKVHPNSIGAEVLAHHWFARLLELNDRTVPSWSEDEMRAAIAKAPTPIKQLGLQRGRKPRISFERIVAREDSNHDHKVTKAEFKGPKKLFDRLDQNRDGILTESDFENRSDTKRSPEMKRPPEPRHLPVPQGVEIIRDIVFGTGGGRPLKLHLVRPKDPGDDALPVFVWIHGGGWKSGSKETAVPRLAHFAQRGFAGATIEYRLSDEATFPAQIEDCKAAIRFLKAHANKYQLDPHRLAVGGSSAGGHLAALVGTSGDVRELEGTGGWPEQSSRVHAVVDFYGPTDLTEFVKTPGYRGHANPNSPESRLLGGKVDQYPALAKSASPISYVDRNDPPFLIIHGSDDRVVPPHQSELLQMALTKANVQVTHHVIQGAGHGGRPFKESVITNMVEDFLCVELLGFDHPAKRP